jgi:hypothetical protein
MSLNGCSKFHLFLNAKSRLSFVNTGNRRDEQCKAADFHGIMYFV